MEQARQENNDKQYFINHGSLSGTRTNHFNNNVFGNRFLWKLLIKGKGSPFNQKRTRLMYGHDRKK